MLGIVLYSSAQLLCVHYGCLSNQFIHLLIFVGRVRTETVRSMAHRIQTVRQLLFQKLKALGTPGNWDHIVQQNGMFCYTGLSGQSLSLCMPCLLFCTMFQKLNHKLMAVTFTTGNIVKFSVNPYIVFHHTFSTLKIGEDSTASLQ